MKEDEEDEDEASNSCDEEILKWLATNGTCSPVRSSDGREEREREKAKGTTRNESL